jgi:glycosyltransferase involved in cell wall biosynthesis
MKILVLTSTYSRWKNDIEPRFVDNLCYYLSQKDEVHVIAPHAKNACTEEILDGIRVYRFRYAIENWETLAYEGGILPRLKQNRLRILLVPLFILSQLLLVIKLIRRNEYDVIHAHWMIPQGLVAVLARSILRSKTPIVLTSHGGDMFAFRGALPSAIKRWITSRVDILTVVSSTMKTMAANSGLKSEQDIVVIPMGVDTLGDFRPPEKSTSREGLLFVGRLVEKKGIVYLIQAMSMVLEKHPNEVLTIIGDGPLKQELIDLCNDHGVANNVVFKGALLNSEIPDYLRRSAVTIFPSVVAESGDQEGTPVALMEALACECASIVSDYPGARDIICDNENGLLVAQKSPEQIAEKLLTLLANPTIRQALGSNGRKTIQEHYDWRVVSAKFLSVFERTLTPEGETALNHSPYRE